MARKIERASTMAKKPKPKVNHKTPAPVAYVMGYEDGIKESGRNGFVASNMLTLLAYYNVIDDFIKTEKTQAGLARAMEEELGRLFIEEFANDYDNIAIAISKLNEIRAKYKMELIVWDTTPPQPGSGAKGRVYKEYLSAEGN